MSDLLLEFKTYLYLGNFEQAERLVQNQLAIEPNSAFWFNELALLFFAKSCFSDALIHFDKAIEIDSNFSEAVLNSIILLNDLGYYKEAEYRFSALEELELQKNTGSYEKSTTEKIVKQYIKLAKFYTDLNQVETAINILKNIVHEFKSHLLHKDLAKLYLMQGDINLAIEHIEWASRLNSVDAEIYVLAAQCYLQQNRKKEAHEALTNAELLNDVSKTGNVLRTIIKQVS